MFDNKQHTDETRHGVTILFTVSALAATVELVAEEDCETDMLPNTRVVASQII